jgi:hypothetical protein
MIIAPEVPPQTKLTDGTKKLISSISSDIVKAWPPFPDATNPDSRNTLVLVNAYAFVTQIFNPRLQTKIHEDVNNGKKVWM